MLHTALTKLSKRIWRPARPAFTLIELLMVIAIIGILAVLTIVNLIGAQAKGRDAGRKVKARSVASALEQSAQDNAQAYPHPFTDGGGTDVTTALSASLVPTYLATTNVFIHNKTAKYITNFTGSNYAEAWELENTTEATVTTGFGVYAANSVGVSGVTTVTRTTGSAINFNNSSQILLSAAAINDNNNGFSVSFWFKPPDASGTKFISKCPSLLPCTGDGWKIETNTSNKVVFTGYISGTPSVLTTNTALTTGSWAHVVITYDGTTAAGSGKVYINGVADTATFSPPPSTASRINNTNAGIEVASGSGPLGDYDNLGLYNIVLPSTTVALMYNNGMSQYMTNGEAGIVAGWRFDEGTGTVASDVIGESAPLAAGTPHNLSVTTNLWTAVGVAPLGLTWSTQLNNPRSFVTYGPP